jgi:hypothetical protein
MLDAMNEKASPPTRKGTFTADFSYSSKPIKTKGYKETIISRRGKVPHRARKLVDSLAKELTEIFKPS